MLRGIWPGELSSSLWKKVQVLGFGLDAKESKGPKKMLYKP